MVDENAVEPFGVGLEVHVSGSLYVIDLSALVSQSLRQPSQQSKRSRMPCLIAASFCWLRWPFRISARKVHLLEGVSDCHEMHTPSITATAPALIHL